MICVYVCYILFFIKQYLTRSISKLQVTGFYNSRYTYCLGIKILIIHKITYIRMISVRKANISASITNNQNKHCLLNIYIAKVAYRNRFLTLQKILQTLMKSVKRICVKKERAFTQWKVGFVLLRNTGICLFNNWQYFRHKKMTESWQLCSKNNCIHVSYIASLEIFSKSFHDQFVHKFLFNIWRCCAVRLIIYHAKQIK